MISEFQNENRFLSNFTEVPVTFEGHEYCSVEHAYVAAKTTSDLVRWEIRQLPTAGQAKSFGKTLVIREDWHEVRLGIMEDLLRQKFAVPEFRELLFATGTQEIVEGNKWHDTFWGKCNCSDHKGEGENNLGELLMKIREEIRQPSLFSIDFESST